jgi:hypothetical protein
MTDSYLIDHLKTKRAAQMKRTALHERRQIGTCSLPPLGWIQAGWFIRHRLALRRRFFCLAGQVEPPQCRRKVSEKSMIKPKL